MRLLLAEDEKILADALTTILAHSHYTVDAVYNGQDALDYLETGVYDGAILDIMMPKIDGLTVLKSLRAAGNRIPVLLLTAKSEIDDRVLGLDSGADDYLTKPFAMKELLARIRAITRRQPMLQDNELRFGDLILSRTDFTLSGPSGFVHLTNKEFQMLELMMSNPNQVISTERFLEKIWGYGSEPEVNVVWVNLSGLRKKLAGLQAKVQIKATRGVGYLLEEIR
ncbi:MAG: response regulator transcription factor [Candidatus Limivivens sp.]|nr:response regulator transcription factor [Candidatus Limivivens sp.]